jgi:Protein of unknown function (DUF2971)
MLAKSMLLRRYTSFSSLLHILTTRQLTLLDPNSWDDSNDAYFLNASLRHEGAKQIFALCFSEAAHTYHHWSVFAQGAEGVCISFKKASLEKAISQPTHEDRKFEFEKVKYLPAKQAKAYIKSDPKRLKFTKNVRYADEKEWRCTCTCMQLDCANPVVRIKLASIDRITISPWLHVSLFGTLKNIIAAVPGCSNIRVERSTLINFHSWKTIADDLRVKKSRSD